jgi:hypothetical protein
MQNLFICKFHEACKEIKIPRKIWIFFAQELDERNFKHLQHPDHEGESLWP